jgi:hypothetical protein
MARILTTLLVADARSLTSGHTSGGTTMSCLGRVLAIRIAIALCTCIASLPVATMTFAWILPICNPSTGEVLQPNQFPSEAAYNQYLKDHPGSFQMHSAESCFVLPPGLRPASATAAPVSVSTSSPAPAAGTSVCLVTKNSAGTTVEQRRVVDVARFIASHQGSFVVASGKDCGPTFTPIATTSSPNVVGEVEVAGVQLSAPENDETAAAEPEADIATEELDVPVEVEE